MSADGSEKRKLTDTAGSDDGPIWSPHGSQIAFSSYRNGDRDLYVMNTDGSDQPRATDWPGAESPEAWLPDGRIIFAASKEEAPLPTWYLVRPDRSDLASLSWLDEARANSPLDWVPLDSCR